MTRKSLLITGCSSGIGHDAAHQLAARGWRVFATARKPEDVARLAAEGLESLHLDHTDAETIRNALAEITARAGGRLDAIFANGAYGLPAAADNSSILGFTALRWRAAYVATKFALEGYADTLRVDFADTNIRVSLIQPGPIATEFRRNSQPHFERWIDWRNSALRDRYEASVLPRLYDESGRPDPFQLPPAAVTRALIHALEARWPKPRYPVTFPTRAATLLKRLLPTRVTDRITARF